MSLLNKKLSVLIITLISGFIFCFSSYSIFVESVDEFGNTVFVPAETLNDEPDELSEYIDGEDEELPIDSEDEEPYVPADTDITENEDSVTEAPDDFEDTTPDDSEDTMTSETTPETTTTTETTTTAASTTTVATTTAPQTTAATTVSVTPAPVVVTTSEPVTENTEETESESARTEDTTIAIANVTDDEMNISGGVQVSEDTGFISAPEEEPSDNFSSLITVLIIIVVIVIAGAVSPFVYIYFRKKKIYQY